jgi:hypothetical protein
MTVTYEIFRWEIRETQKSVKGQIRWHKWIGELRLQRYWSFLTHASVSSDEDVPTSRQKAHTKHEDLM